MRFLTLAIGRHKKTPGDPGVSSLMSGVDTIYEVGL
mgnify:FL=1